MVDFDHLNVEIQIDREIYLKAEIMDVNQKSLHTLTEGQLSRGQHNLGWDGGNVSAAPYYFKISTADGVWLQPLMKLN